MKDIIKKVLKEDLDWVKDIDPLANYLKWLTENYDTRWKNNFDDVIDVVYYPRMDAETMVRAGRIIEDPTQDTQRRIEAINEFEDFSQIGTIIENTRLYIRYIVEYVEDSGLEESTVVEMANEIVYRNLHKKKRNG